jgi:flagellar protein FlaG
VASVSASHLIIFIASVLVAASVAGTITNTVGDLSGAITEQGVDVSNDVRTDVEIISDSGAQVYNRSGNGNVTLLVKNTGSNRLSADTGGVDVVLDGALRTAVSLTVVTGDDPTVWGPNDVARIEVSVPGLAPGDHRIQLTINGDEEVFEFQS